LLLFPYILVLLIIAGYVCIIPFTIRSQRWVAARPEAWDAKPQQRRAVRRAARRAAAPNRRSVTRLGLRRPGPRR
jgi:CDP-diacylglycerol--serine O-phosphatidyltransferase